MIFTIAGAPRTKKNSQQIWLNKRTGARFIAPSKCANNWTQIAVRQLIEQRADALELARPLNCCALIYRERSTGDACNYYQAIADALEASGAVVNDKWIVSWDGSRLLKDSVIPRTEIVLTFVD